MAEINSFPNNQDEYRGAEYVMKWFHGRTSGVFGAGDNVAVAALSTPGMAVTVSDGVGWMANAKADGVVWWIDSEATSTAKLQLSIDPADGVLNRIDRVIVEWKTTNYVDYPEVKILTGTAKSNPSVPELINNSTVRQISLARISIPAGTTEITASMITDERLDPSVCGLVTESVGVDTSVINAQVQELLERLTQELENIEGGVAYVLKTGDTMTGPLNLPAPTEDTDAANKQYVDGKKFTASFTIGTAWVGDTAPYTQTVAVPGILETDYPHLWLESSDDKETRTKQREALAMITDGDTAANSITFTCDEEKPSVEIPVYIEVSR